MEALIFRNGIATATDDVSGKELVPALVPLALDEEIAYFVKRGIYKVVLRSHQKTTGDVEAPDCRSRLVGRSFNIGRDDNLCAANPPLEAWRWVLSFSATWRRGSSRKRRCVIINDVKRAYFFASIQRDVYIEVPREDPNAGPHVLGKIKLCLSGTRDAANGVAGRAQPTARGDWFRQGRQASVGVLAPHSRALNDCARRRLRLQWLRPGPPAVGGGALEGLQNQNAEAWA